jgi:hypothetical protein
MNVFFLTFNLLVYLFLKRKETFWWSIDFFEIKNQNNYYNFFKIITRENY